MKKLLPIIIIVICVAGGAGAGFFLRPEPEIVEIDPDAEIVEEEEEEVQDDNIAFVKLNNQFVVPIVKEDKVRALVVMSITLQTDTDSSEGLYEKEPKVRDAFLRVLFDHAYGGGFDGAFTTSPTLEALRHALLEAAHSEIGKEVHDVLITDIVRQDA